MISAFDWEINKEWIETEKERRIRSVYQDKKESLRVKGEREVVVAFAKEKPNAFVGEKKNKQYRQ